MATKPKMVRVEIDLPGQGEEAHEFGYCPMSHHGTHLPDGGGWSCPIRGGACRFGLTETEPPQACPMRSGSGTMVVTMKFSLVPKK